MAATRRATKWQGKIQRGRRSLVSKHHSRLTQDPRGRALWLGGEQLPEILRGEPGRRWRGLIVQADQGQLITISDEP